MRALFSHEGSVQDCIRSCFAGLVGLCSQLITEEAPLWPIIVKWIMCVTTEGLGIQLWLLITGQ